ncbi:MAG: hypothetical protein RL084_1925 [Pseudomonadota bacterium]
MTNIHDAFSKSYAEARQKFLAAAAQVGLQVESHIHPNKGRDGEELAMDVAREGPADAKHVLLVSSACHGVEGYCGSGVQIDALRSAEWHKAVAQSGVAVVYVHALNPHGFSHVRRVTQENVDLNRNFHDFSKPLPDNTAYKEVQHLLLPDVWPPNEANMQATMQYIATHGMPKLQAAVSQGQHHDPKGLFFGGQAPTWSNQTIRKVLKQHGCTAQKLAWIDLHTGLGPSGIGERIYAGANDAAAIQRARTWWGNITSIYDGTSSSAFLTGLMWMSVQDECPQTEYTGIALEYGTLPMNDMLMALRADHWLHLHPEASDDLKKSIKAQIFNAFYTDTDEWRAQIISQARDAMAQAIQGLK